MSSLDKYASPPCSWHELDEFRHGESQPPSVDAADIADWRRLERKRQIDARRAIPAADRAEKSARIVAHIERIIGHPEGRCVSLYWPIRGEPDLRALVPAIIERGGACALPVVIARGHALVFRVWRPGERLERGVWNIPVPAAGREIEPDVVLAPVVAFDRACYRLGYGGGYYDRTLAALAGRPRAVGVGFSTAEIATIYPQPHDVAMDMIVTEDGQIER